MTPLASDCHRYSYGSCSSNRDWDRTRRRGTPVDRGRGGNPVTTSIGLGFYVYGAYGSGFYTLYELSKLAEPL